MKKKCMDSKTQMLEFFMEKLSMYDSKIHF